MLLVSRGAEGFDHICRFASKCPEHEREGGSTLFIHRAVEARQAVKNTGPLARKKGDILLFQTFSLSRNSFQ